MLVTLKSIVTVLLLIFSPCSGKMEGFIVGGDITQIDMFPHAVYLWMTHNKESWICGASILNQEILLTAAHCLEDCEDNWSVKAYVGSEKISKMKFVRSVDKYILHRNYNPKTTANDIGLAHVRTNLPLGRNVKRVIIERNFDNSRSAYVAGWGLVNDKTEEDTDNLKTVVQRLQSKRVCKKIGELAAGMMCFSNSIVARPSKGDSGSALTTKNGQQIGLVSFRHPRSPELVVYTNVSYYYDWIRQCSRMLYCRAKRNKKSAVL